MRCFQIVAFNFNLRRYDKEKQPVLDGTDHVIAVAPMASDKY
jgi:hypothetical protein